MLDAQKELDIYKWQMTSLQSVFVEAVECFSKEYHGKKQNFGPTRKSMSHAALPPVYVDCGNTLFDKSEDVPTIRPNFLNFLIALKNSGYDVRLMSHEPLKYVDILRDELVARGHSHRFFEDESGLSILRKEVTNDSTKGLLLIDNDVFSIPIKIYRRIDPKDPAFISELEAYSDPAASIPEEMRADVLWGRFHRLSLDSKAFSPHP